MLKFRDKLMTVVVLMSAFVAPAHAGEDQFFGTLTGATVGGIVGSQFGHGDGRIAGATVGVLAGGWAGNDIGYAMDNERSTSTASGGTRGPVTGSVMYQSGYAPNYVAPDDSPSPESITANYCRAYSQQMFVNGQVQQSTGTACLQPDGTWSAVGQ